MKFTQIPVNTFKELQMNAGILVDKFNPETGVVGNLIGATTGGINFKDTASYTDLGNDIDNCPKNMMELKRLENHEVTMGGTFLTVTAESAKMLAATADMDENDGTHIIPRNDVLMKDFVELWWIGDYSDINTGDNAGFLAIHLMNALNTDGFQIQSTDKGKGNLAFTFTGHYSMEAQDKVPYEIYIRQGVDAKVKAFPESPDAELFDTLVSEMQSDISIKDGVINGVLHFIEGGLAETGPLAGDGNFLALKFTADDWENYTSVKVGLDPSQGTGLVEIITDPDKNGVFKIADKNQVFKIVADDGENTITSTYSLTGLILETE